MSGRLSRGTHDEGAGMKKFVDCLAFLPGDWTKYMNRILYEPWVCGCDLETYPKKFLKELNGYFAGADIQA